MRRMKLKSLAEDALRVFEYKRQLKIEKLRAAELQSAKDHEAVENVLFSLVDAICEKSRLEEIARLELKKQKSSDFLFDFVDKYEVWKHNKNINTQYF